MALRPLADKDVSQVADLIWRVLHGQNGAAPLSLHSYVQDLFLRNPWFDEQIVSRVSENTEGKINAFFGAVPRRMSFQGKTVRMAFGSNFVVDPEIRKSTVAVQLVRSFLKGPQDISITDSANEDSRQLLRSLGFSIVPIYSMQWARPLRPARYAVSAAARLKKSSLITSIGTLSRPLTAIVDGIAARTRLSPFHQSEVSTKGEELSTPALLEGLAQFPSKQWLLPEYDESSLNWVFDFIAKRKVLGEIRRILVRDTSQRTLGWFVYAIPPGGVAEVLQLGADSRSANRVLDHLFHDAWQRGLIGIHGRLEPQFMQEMTMKSSFFFRNGSWTLMHSNRPDLFGALQSGSAFFSRLEGEWCLRHGGGHV